MRLHAFVPLAGTLLGVLLAGQAHADQPRVHDGFQFHGLIGPGYVSDLESGSDGNNYSISGPAVSLEAYFGGSPLRGFSVGGYVAWSHLFNASVSSGGQSTPTPDGATFEPGHVGPYVDWYPAPCGGFHVLATVGILNLSVSNGQQKSPNSGVGIALGLGLGYDLWVADDWSVGLLARATYGRTRLSEYVDDGTGTGNTITVNVNDSMIVPALLLSATYQ